MPRTLLRRLDRVLTDTFPDIISHTRYKNKRLHIYYKDGLTDILMMSYKNYKNKLKTARRKEYYYIIDDDYDNLLFPFKEIEFIKYSDPLEIPIINFKCKFLINQLVNLHRTIIIFSDIDAFPTHKNLIFHNRKINVPMYLRIAIMSILKEKIPSINENTIYQNLPYFNKDYTKILDDIKSRVDIKSMNDLTNNESIEKWCNKNKISYGEGNFYFYDTLNWLENNLMIYIPKSKEWVQIDMEKLKEIKSLKHCIFVTDVLREDFRELINFKLDFDIKLKLKYSYDYILKVLVW